MLLKVDNRERTIIPALETACQKLEGVLVETSNMPLGDAGIYTREGEELILFERKTLSDLAASIKDGRYAEQSMRLAALDIPNHHVVYIIEGSFDQYNANKHRVHPDTLISAMISLNYYKGFSVIRSWNPLETVGLIARYVEKLHKTKDRVPFYRLSVEQKGKSRTNTEEPNYVSVIKRTKKENVTVANIVSIMLCQIPNVSTASAEAIAQAFPTMEKLVQACRQGRSSFDNIRIGKTQRRLSAQCQHNVITFVLGESAEELSVEA